MTLLRRVRSAYYSVLGYYEAVCRVLAWIPVIWNTPDWDHAHLYRVMAFKLRRMQRATEHDSLHVSAPRDARNIQICAHVLERLADGELEFPTRERDREREFLEIFSKIFVRQSRGWWL